MEKLIEYLIAEVHANPTLFGMAVFFFLSSVIRTAPKPPESKDRPTVAAILVFLYTWAYDLSHMMLANWDQMGKRKDPKEQKQ